MDGVAEIHRWPLEFCMRRIIHVLVYLLLITAGALAATLLATIITPRSWPAALAWLIKAVLVASVVVVITHIHLRRAGIRWVEFGVSGRSLATQAGRGFSWGLALALAWSGAMYCIAPHDATWNPRLVPSYWWAASLGTVAMAIAEEVGYRSYALRELHRSSGYIPAVVIPTVVFVAAHFAGGVPWQPAVMVVGSTSVLLAVIMLETRSLPLVIALHAMTNLVQDNLLRPSPDASLFTLAPGTGPTAADSLAVWLAMMSINVIATGTLLGMRRRGRAPRP
jgi:membrane protease YdiL (CAAX protease family)